MPYCSLVVQVDEPLLQMQQKMAVTVVLIINKRNSWRILAAFCGPARPRLGLLGVRDRLRLGGGGGLRFEPTFSGAQDP